MDIDINQNNEDSNESSRYYLGNDLKYSRDKSSYKRSNRSSSSSSSRSQSPRHYHRKRYYGSRENPDRSRILGVFGLSTDVGEHDLMELFTRYGPIEHICVVYDAKTKNSRGFGFVYFDRMKDASRARRHCNGKRFFNKRIRVDYSMTKRPHTPTPGTYMGMNQPGYFQRYHRRSYREYNNSYSSSRKHSRSNSR